MQPLCLQPQVFANDDLAYGITDASITVSVLYNDTKFITNIDPATVSTTDVIQPSNGSVSVNPDATITYTPNFGYNGIDTFQYSVCSLEYPDVCDIATVTVNTSDCPTPSNRNLVFGQAYVDADGDMVNNDGIGLENIQINIYEDLNTNGVIDGGDLPLPTTPSTITDVNGNYQYEVPSYDITIADDFSSNNYTGGSSEWSGSWIEVGDDSNSATGDVSIVLERLKLENNSSISRQVDLIDATFATISFNIFEEGDIDSNDEVKVEICSDNTFTNCQILYFSADDFTSASIVGTVIEPDKLTATTHFRVVVDQYTTDEEVFIDDIAIFATIRGKNLLMETEASSIPSNYALSTDNLQTAIFATGITGNCKKANDFGFLGCDMSDPGIAFSCDDNGTPMDASDDTFSFTLNPDGLRFGSTYTVSGDVTGTGTYGAPVSFGPFPSSDLSKTITIADDTGNCGLVDVEVSVSVSQCLSSTIPTSVDFDGVDDYLSTTGFLDGLQEVTLMAWVKVDPTYAGGKTLTIASEDISCMLTLNSGNIPVFTVRTDITPTIAVNADPIINDEWHHITATFSGITGEQNIYVDGKLEGTSPTDFTGAFIKMTGTGNGNFEVGRFSKDTAPDQNYFFGAIDEVRVFDAALTESQIQRSVYQQIEQNGVNVKGSIIDKNILDITTENTVPWSNLVTYYNMSDIADGKVIDKSSFTKDAQLFNITTILPQSAPMPYETVADGPWTAQATWLHGNVWDIEDIPNNKDWSIVHIHDSITTTASHKHLGLLVDAGKTLVVGDTALDDQDFEVNNTWYLELNGTLDLQDDSQLIQGTSSDLVTGVNGKILRRQEGTSNKFWYNYWASPVGSLGATTLTDNNGPTNNTNNTPFNLDMIKDGSWTGHRIYNSL